MTMTKTVNIHSLLTATHWRSDQDPYASALDVECESAEQLAEVIAQHGSLWGGDEMHGGWDSAPPAFGWDSVLLPEQEEQLIEQRIAAGRDEALEALIEDDASVDELSAAWDAATMAHAKILADALWALHGE